MAFLFCRPYLPVAVTKELGLALSKCQLPSRQTKVTSLFYVNLLQIFKDDGRRCNKLDKNRAIGLRAVANSD